jgi:hypothetical protein
MGTVVLGTPNTPGTLAGEVKAGLGNRSDTDGRIVTALNFSQERIARLYDFAEMNKTVTSTMTYTGDPQVDMFIPMPDVAPFIREIFSVVLMDGTRAHKLRQIPTRTWDRVLGDPSALSGNDRPYFYTVWDYSSAKAEIYPLPTDTLPINWRISQWPTPLVNPNDKSIFRFKDELIIEGALIYLMYSLGKEEDAQKHVKKLAGFMEEAVKADPREPDIDVQPSPNSEMQGDFQGAYWTNPFIKSIEDSFR